MYRILILLLSSVIANLVYSAEVFFDKKPSVLILKDKEFQNPKNSSEVVDFFDLSKQQKLYRTNQLFKQAEKDKDVIFQTSNLSDYDKAQYSRENKFSNFKGSSPHIEPTPNRQVISEEEYQQQMEQYRKTHYVERGFIF
ncbi:hypothetical protein [Acinetobacter sp. IK40]|jgi:hypothetical protein|uniref:hypothetical protein n=1 Tax=Acinetobacter sp. IK40 TaxID=2928897 RepID=UPI002D1ED960|nr:hypothetical protein [Acinetobacter sp. IK40]MEB3790826.1 hypothetical protein [Acinetobacter sp. IK40]